MGDYIMSHVCPHCQLQCPSYFSYKIHLETHIKHVVDPKTLGKLVKRMLTGVKQPLSDQAFIDAVARGEAKLGVKAFNLEPKEEVNGLAF